MKVVILAGGLGSRISEITKKIPKPMIKVGGQPIILRIINHYFKYGFDDFIIAGGYKYKEIKEFFNNKKFKFKVKVINTGLKSMTGGRLLKLKKLLKNERFCLTYGDGISNVNLKKLLKFHIANEKKGTVTAVHPVARFGEIILKKNLVSSFKEKPQTKKDWINGGFFIFEPDFLKYIKKSSDVLEGYPLEQLTKKNQLSAFRHEGFWHCMDTKRDMDLINNLIKNNKNLL
jgi:glucose-1-phosphate cytidylyltransferase|tara:strand:- start:979 stop:1671 length:693 start_codon:yes stop_codon:yes gene_type:complete